MKIPTWQQMRLLTQHQWRGTHGNTRLTSFEIDGILTMRREGDYTPDDVLKKSWLDELSDTERRSLCGCFDDRDRIVKMYRENGVACFQVADGDF